MIDQIELEITIAVVIKIVLILTQICRRNLRLTAIKFSS